MGDSTCYCIGFKPDCDTFADYIDCDANPVTIEVFSGQTYILCSLDGVLDSYCGRLPINVTNYGPCDTTLPCNPITTTTTTFFPTTTTTTTFFPTPQIPLEPTNECDVITIFPMGVECKSIDPSFTNTYDGVVSLNITGGTPPYEILWDNGNVGPTISNLGVGEYTATVTDTYGDFLIKSTCVLTAETPTTTTTTTTTPIPSSPDLCMIIESYDERKPEIKQIDFIYDGIVNGKPSWLSSVNNYLMFWNTGTTQEWLVSGITSYTIYNPNPATPPLVGWVGLGGKVTITVIEGSCSSISRLYLSINKNEPTCTNNGSIIVQATGGIPPYEYSKNGGSSYQTSPIFNNLSGGNFLIKVKDSIGITQTQFVTLTPTITTSTVYTLTLNKTSNTFNVTVSPTLPAGVTLNFDLVYQSTFNIAPNPTSASYNGGLNVLLNGGPILSSPAIVTNTTIFNPCNGGSIYTTNTSRTWGNISMTTSSTLNGTINDTITPVLPFPTCYSGTRTYNIILNNVSITGCECCSYLIQQSAPEYSIGKL